MREPVKLRPYENDVFRVFSTAHPSQDLLDDLLADPEAEAGLQRFYHDAEECAKPPLQRVLERSDQSVLQQEISSKFQPENWYSSRYSDGSFGVLYAAESEKTALKESLYHKRRFYAEELQLKPIALDLRVAKLKLKSEHGVDLLEQKGVSAELLVSQDESGYPYCQALAKQAREQGVELFRAPSARDQGGFCTPIFEVRAVQKDRGHLKFVKCVLSEEAVEIFRKLELV